MSKDLDLTEAIEKEKCEDRNSDPVTDPKNPEYIEPGVGIKQLGDAR